MDRFLIISPHAPKDCDKAIQQVEAMGYLTHFDWGCHDGEHTGWVTLEAESNKQALIVVPTFLRTKARAIKVEKFSPNQPDTVHLRRSV